MYHHWKLQCIYIYNTVASYIYEYNLKIGELKLLLTSVFKCCNSYAHIKLQCNIKFIHANIYCISAVLLYEILINIHIVYIKLALMFLYMHTVKSLVMMHTISYIPCIFGFLPDDDPQRAETRRRQYVT